MSLDKGMDKVSQQVLRFDTAIQHVACGFSFALVTTIDGKAFGIGNNENKVNDETGNKWM